MKWRLLATWLVIDIAAAGLSDSGPGRIRGPFLGPWFAADAACGAEATRWELQPYRLHAILCADSSPAWSSERLLGLARSLEQRSAVEYGRVWQITVDVAGPEVQQSVLIAADGGRSQDVERFLVRDETVDKWIVIVLRASADGPAVEAWEYDLTSRRWNCAPARSLEAWPRLEQVVFESLAEVCSPLAIVKSHGEQRAVLRLRGGLLPVRNPRRASVQAGSIFQLAANNVSLAMDSPMPSAYVIVEKVAGHLLECRSTSSLPNPVTENAVDRWIAVGVRPLHAATELSLALALAGGAPGAPLAGCDIWLSDRRESQGTCLGRADQRGAIVVPAAEGIRWLHLRWGAVLLDQFPVVPGWQARQRFATHVRPATLIVAATLSECHDDVAELAVLRNLYRARAKSLERSGQTAESQALLEECQTLLQTRVPALRDDIRERRHRVEQAVANQRDRDAAPWQALGNALEQLLQSPDAKSP